MRELRNLVERLLILTSGTTIGLKDIPLLTSTSEKEDSILPEFMGCEEFLEFKDRSEALYLQHKLKENRYNISKTAEKLGMQRSNLYKKINKYALDTEPPA